MLSDCLKCWETPCSCGYYYKKYPKITLSEHISNITKYRTKEEAVEILLRAIELVKQDNKR